MPKTSPKKKTAKKSSEPKRIVQVTFEMNQEKYFKKYIKYLSDPKHIILRNFLAGTFHGLGFILGSAVVIYFIGLFFSQVLQNISFFSDFAEAVNIWLDTTLQSR